MLNSDIRHSKPLFTSSWDDGHPLDTRLAELLQRHGCKATFFVPSANREGLPVLSDAQIRLLAANGFEIGSHTLDHCYLTSVDAKTAQEQIAMGKMRLEAALGEAVEGFCYPGGKFRAEHCEMVRKAGFTYARTTVNLHGEVNPDPFAMPVSIQCYPHSAAVYLRNFALYGSWGRRIRMLPAALSAKNLSSRLKNTLDAVCMRGGVFHLWGHSWELDRIDGWSVLDDFLSYVAERIPAEDRLTNREALRRRSVLP